MYCKIWDQCECESFECYAFQTRFIWFNITYGHSAHAHKYGAGSAVQIFLELEGKGRLKNYQLLLFELFVRFAIHLSWILLCRARFRTAKTFLWSDRVHLQKHRAFSETFSISIKENVHIYPSVWEKKWIFPLALPSISTPFPFIFWR